jgi:peptide deformylase
MSKNIIKIYGEDVLRQKCVPVQFPNTDLNQIVMSMLLVMYKLRGVGLAANQVGLNERIAVINVDPMAKEEEQVILINPEIVSKSEKISEGDEGCLSVPGIHAPRKRHESITVKNYDLDGTMYTFDADGLLATAVQHEIDHLDGLLFFDDIDYVQRSMIATKLKRLARASKAGETFYN